MRRVASIPAGLRFTISPGGSCFRADAVSIGDSISISGCCLTVVAISGDALDFEAGEETLSKTNLGRLVVGGQVNLERSLAVGSRLGGHFVQGHVDGTGIVDDIRRQADWIDMWFRVPVHLVRLMVPKGSIAVDGISLTLVHVDSPVDKGERTDWRFSVALIPHTLQVTTLGQRVVGDAVNLENDILGKYVERILSFGRGNEHSSGNADSRGRAETGGAA